MRKEHSTAVEWRAGDAGARQDFNRHSDDMALLLLCGGAAGKQADAPSPHTQHAVLRLTLFPNSLSPQVESEWKSHTWTEEDENHCMNKGKLVRKHVV